MHWKTYKVISKVDLICINDEEVIQLSGCKDYKLGVKKFLQWVLNIIMKKVNLGYIYSMKMNFSVHSFKIERLDPTGAGDSFAGAFAWLFGKIK